MVPVAEQGASRRAASNGPPCHSRASATTISAASPVRERFSPSVASRASEMSRAVTAAPAAATRCIVLPPGAAQRSSHRHTGRGAEKLRGQSRGRVLHPPCALGVSRQSADLTGAGEADRAGRQQGAPGHLRHLRRVPFRAQVEGRNAGVHRLHGGDAILAVGFGEAFSERLRQFRQGQRRPVRSFGNAPQNGVGHAREPFLAGPDPDKRDQCGDNAVGGLPGDVDPRRPRGAGGFRTSSGGRWRMWRPINLFRPLGPAQGFRCETARTRPPRPGRALREFRVRRRPSDAARRSLRTRNVEGRCTGPARRCVACLHPEGRLYHTCMTGKTTDTELPDAARRALAEAEERRKAEPHLSSPERTRGTRWPRARPLRGLGAQGDSRRLLDQRRRRSA